MSTMFSRWRRVRRERAGFLIPPDGPQAKRAIAERTKRLVDAKAVDGADNPLSGLIEVLGQWWEETEPRPLPAPTRASPVIQDSVGENTEPSSAGASASSSAPVDTTDGSGEGSLPAARAVIPSDRTAAVGKRRHTALRLLMVLAFAGDVANFYMALSVVGNTAPVVTVLVVVALACSALGLAHLVGRFLRDRADGRSTPRGVVAGLATVVLLLGLAAAAVRLSAPLPETASGGEVFGGGDTALLSPLLVNVVLTVLLLVLFLASAAMAAVLGYDASDRVEPSGSSQTWSGWARTRLQRWETDRRSRRAADRVHAHAEAEEEYRIRRANHRFLAEFLCRDAAGDLAVACGEPRLTTVLTHTATEDPS